MVRHNEYSIRFIPLTDLLHVLQEILPDIRPDQKKKGMNKLVKTSFAQIRWKPMQ